jgi:hypothetical protein
MRIFVQQHFGFATILGRVLAKTVIRATVPMRRWCSTATVGLRYDTPNGRHLRPMKSAHIHASSVAHTPRCASPYKVKVADDEATAETVYYVPNWMKLVPVSGSVSGKNS